MKTHTFSIVVGNGACNANCPFCISKMTESAISASTCFDEGRFNVCCRIVDQMREGLLTVLLTGQGEPMLFPQQISRYLDCINFRFPIIELQTNGTLIEKNIENLRQWRDKGLTLVCISIASGGEANNHLMGIDDESYDPWRAASILQEIGLNVRLNCTMTKVGTYLPEDCEKIIDRANNAAIDQITFREVEMPSLLAYGKISDWVKLHKPYGAAEKLHHYLCMKGAIRLLELPHGGIVYDYHGQNVAVTNCLTGTVNPNDIRQVIFFPDGRVAYDWRFKGARLL